MRQISAGRFVTALLASSLLIASVFAQDVETALAAGLEALERGDVVTAARNFSIAAEAGSALAQAKLAWIRDASEDDAEAVRLFRASAVQGHPEGEYGLAEMYIKGEGVAQDYDEAILWLERAAEHGHARAAGMLVSVYRNGRFGRPVDPAKAEYWNERLEAAQAASAEADDAGGT